MTNAKPIADPGSHQMIWRHKKSDYRYIVITHALLENDLSTVVVYQRADDCGPVWVRPLSEFLDGRFIQENSNAV